MGQLTNYIINTCKGLNHFTNNIPGTITQKKKQVQYNWHKY